MVLLSQFKQENNVSSMKCSLSVFIFICSLHTEPTAPPQNVTYGGRTNVSITLIWNPPPFEHQNGQIRSYSIRVIYPLSGTQQLLTTNSSYTNFTIRGLLPYSNYFFSIAAETISLGPYSSTVNISTVEGSKLHTHSYLNFMECSVLFEL